MDNSPVSRNLLSDDFYYDKNNNKIKGAKL